MRVAEGMEDILLDNPHGKSAFHEMLERLRDLGVIKSPETFEVYPEPVSPSE
jgi:hypothetical protein